MRADRHGRVAPQSPIGVVDGRAHVPAARCRGSGRCRARPRPRIVGAALVPCSAASIDSLPVQHDVALQQPERVADLEVAHLHAQIGGAGRRESAVDEQPARRAVGQLDALDLDARLPPADRARARRGPQRRVEAQAQLRELGLSLRRRRSRSRRAAHTSGRCPGTPRPARCRCSCRRRRAATCRGRRGCRARSRSAPHRVGDRGDRERAARRPRADPVVRDARALAPCCRARRARSRPRGRARRSRSSEPRTARPPRRPIPTASRARSCCGVSTATGFGGGASPAASATASRCATRAESARAVARRAATIAGRGATVAGVGRQVARELPQRVDRRRGTAARPCAPSTSPNAPDDVRHGAGRAHRERVDREQAPRGVHAGCATSRPPPCRSSTS